MFVCISVIVIVNQSIVVHNELCPYTSDLPTDATLFVQLNNTVEIVRSDSSLPKRIIALSLMIVPLETIQVRVDVDLP